ncbi:MAG TPA: CapA family protein [Saccharofermentans sp.]|nr:CapA family protein [Saccharofermentans sp.]
MKFERFFLEKQIEPLTILFVGDAMVHDETLRKAWKPEKGGNGWHFEYPKTPEADLKVVNLETVLGDAPFRGFPEFSAPDKFAIDLHRKEGFDVFLNANNHILDRGQSGLIRTVSVLDWLKVGRTGAFIDHKDKEKNNPLIVERKGRRISISNYTMLLNRKPQPLSSIVNMFSYEDVVNDVAKAEELRVDFKICYMHWGSEYSHKPNKDQLEIANYLHENNLFDVIIGSHPHVPQRVDKFQINGKDHLTAYSLGNFCSDQTDYRGDRGEMLLLKISPDGKLDYSLLEASSK